MSYAIPTFSQLFSDHLSRLESNINQDSPLNDFAFLQVLAQTEAGLDIGHYKFAADAAKQNLALTATDTGLDDIGNNYNTPRKQAQAAIIETDLPSTTGTVIPINTVFTSDANGLRYKTTAEVTAAAGNAALTMKCTKNGTDGNLDIPNTLSISSQISGAETETTVTGTDTIGVNKETDADYRPRVLFAERAVTGGGNATDHRIWAQAVIGVKRAFPFGGRPAAEGTSFPADRTVYVEANTDIDADGIAPGSLLDDVRDDINTDPETGESRSTLGLTDATLFIESIIRTSIYVKMSSLDVDASQEAALKSDMDDALDLYLRAIAPFVDGVDIIAERTDRITGTSVSNIVSDVLDAYGASAQGVIFGLTSGVSAPLSLKLLGQNELTKLGGSVTYA